MLSRDKERRAYRPYAPYLFFALELVAIVELLYVVALVFGLSSVWMVVSGGTALFFSIRIFNRLMYVLRRNREVKRSETLRQREILNY